MVHGYPFKFGASGYPVPLGGLSKVLVPKKIVYHDCAFLRVFIELGNRCTVVRLDESSTPTAVPTATTTSAEQPTSTLTNRGEKKIPVVVYNPIPWGPEARGLLKLLASDTATTSDETATTDEEITETIDVKYLIAPDFEHHMGLDSWKKVYPQARIVGVSGLEEKKKKAGIPVDYVFRGSASGKLITKDLISTLDAENESKYPPLPLDLLEEFDFVYVKEHVNKELVALHKPTKTLLTGDLFVNLPAYDQYSSYNTKVLCPDSGLSFLAKYMSIDSWLSRKLLGFMPKSAAPSIRAIYDWQPKTLVMAHGNIITERATERFGKLFEKYLR